TDLNTLIPGGSEWTLDRAWGINDAGQIVGTGFINGIGNHGYLLVPTTSASLTAGSTARVQIAKTLSPGQVQPVLAGAGVNISSPGGVHLQIPNLPGNEVGEARG